MTRDRFERDERPNRPGPYPATPPAAGSTSQRIPHRSLPGASPDDPRWQEKAKKLAAITINGKPYRLDVGPDGQNIIIAPSGKIIFRCTGLFPVSAIICAIENDRREALYAEADAAAEAAQEEEV